MDSGPVTAEGPTLLMRPVYTLLQFLSLYGWLVVGAAGAGLVLWHRMRPSIDQWRQQREDAAYHKDPDRVLAREEALQRARARQQEQLQRQSARAREERAQKEEEKRAEAARVRGEADKAKQNPIGYFPLNGGGAGGGYRAPKRSACGGGGCGR